MRIALFDSIEELHVATTLRDALERRGHEVRWTGLLWQGFDQPSEEGDVRRLDAVVDEVIEWRPDVLLTFRAASLTPTNLDRLRSAGVRLLAWFNDDPVLFGVSTGPLSHLYDLTLHTGGSDVLALYEDRVDVAGVSFPFYADPAAFPLRYRARTAGQHERAAAVFLGHTHTKQKVWRYRLLKDSGADVVIYGKVRGKPEAFDLLAGYLSDDAAVARTLPRFKVGVSIPQRFSDYRGTAYDFPGLAEMGWYSLPSRVVQMAAVGLPVIDYRPDAPGPAGVPTLEVRTADELRGAVDALARDRRKRARMSLAGYEWFLRSYTTDARAAFLEEIAVDPAGVRKESRERRAEMFHDFGDAPRIQLRQRLSVHLG